MRSAGGPAAGGISAATSGKPAWLDRRFVRDTVVRSAILWVLLRLAWIALAAWSHSDPSVGFNPVNVVGVPALVLADARSLRERVFLANTGIGERHLAAGSAAIALVLETAASIVRALL
jgi:hypothetical protein